MTTLGSVARACLLSLAFTIGATTGACGGSETSEASAVDPRFATASLSRAFEVHYFDAATGSKISTRRAARALHVGH